MSDKKMGRPSSDPKPYSLHVRINETEMKELDEYCKRTNKTRAEGVRVVIRCLKKQK